MKFLHSRRPPIIHGNLKPENVLITNELRAALCDLGTLTHLRGHDESNYWLTELTPDKAWGYSMGLDFTRMSDVYGFGGVILTVSLISSWESRCMTIAFDMGCTDHEWESTVSPNLGTCCSNGHSQLPGSAASGSLSVARWRSFVEFPQEMLVRKPEAPTFSTQSGRKGVSNVYTTTFTDFSCFISIL